MAAPDGAAVLQSLRALHAGIAERSGEIEATRHLPSDIAASIGATGAFRFCVPREIGGVQGTAQELVTAIEEMSQADSAAGWCLMIAGTSGVTAPYLAREVARTIHGDPHTVTGGIFAPRGKAVRDANGYVVSGTWQWASRLKPLPVDEGRLHRLRGRQAAHAARRRARRADDVFPA